MVNGPPMDKDSVLDNFDRGRIFTYLTQNPGSDATQLQSALGLRPEDVKDNLQTMKQHDYVTAKRRGGRTLYYPTSAPGVSRAP